MPIRYVFWLIGSISFVLQLVLQISSGLVAPYIEKAFHLGPLYGNILISSVFFLHILMQIPAGLLVERFGPRKVVGVGSFICVFGCIMFSYSNAFETALVSRIIMGSGLSCSFVAVSAMIAIWFPIYQFGMMVAISEMLGLLAAAIAEQILPSIFLSMPWQVFFQWFAVVAFMLGVTIFLVIRERAVIPTEEEANVSLSEQLFKMMSVPKLWVNGLYSGVAFAVMTGFIAGDASQLLSLIDGISYNMSGQLCASILYGTVVGAAVVSYICLKHDYYQVLRSMFLMSFLCALFLALFIWLPGDFLILRFIAGFLAGFCSATYLFSFRVASDIFQNAKGKSILMGFTNMLSVIVGPLISVTAGFIQRLMLSKGVGGQFVDLFTYQLTCSIFIAALFLGCFMAAWMLRMDQPKVRVSS
tara:strand:+ start:9429 stop:10673 length:1245 start_codon:yes stop_codon:yes gene_type:complete